MVTIEEATKQISEAEIQLTRQEQEIKSAKAGFLREIKPRPTTISRQLELERTFGKGGVRFILEEERKAFARAREETLPRFARAEVQVQEFQVEVGAAKSELEAIKKRNEAIRLQNIAIAERNQQREIALKLFRRGQSVAGETPFVRSIVRKLQEGLAVRREALIKEQFAAAGLEPLFVSGELIGFSDVERQLSFPKEFLSEIGIERLKILERVGAVTLEEPKFTLIEELPKPPTIEEFAFGDIGKQFIGIGVPGIGLPTSLLPIITFEEIKEAGREFRIPEKVTEIISPISRIGVGAFVPEPIRERITITGLKGLEFGVQVGAEFIPTTPGEAAITGALVGALFVAPPIVTVPLLTGVGAFGIKGVLDPELTLQQRVAAGVTVVGAGVGVAGIGIPFIRGIGAKPVKIAPEGFKFVPDIGRVGDIGLIQPGRGARFVDLPIESPLVRGGFGRIPGGERIFLGAEQVIATSQRGFFKVGKDILIERQFFVTPAEPFLKIGETRVSRLGLIEPFKFPKDVEIGFGLPPKPQIGVTIGEIARRERPGVFELGRGTELEAVKTRGIITDIEKIGRVRIKGQAVEIFEFKVGKPDKFGIDLGKIEKFDFRTTEATTRISGEAVLTSTLRITRGISMGISPLISPIVSPLISPTITPTITPPISPPPSPPPPSPPISPISPPGISPITITLPVFTPPTFPPPPPPPLRGIRLKEKEKRKKKRKKARVIIRPSLTAIVLGIEEPAIILPTLGVLPSQIRGLRTGFEVVRKKKKISKKKKKKKN